MSLLGTLLQVAYVAKQSPKKDSSLLNKNTGSSCYAYISPPKTTTHFTGVVVPYNPG